MRRCSAFLMMVTVLVVVGAGGCMQKMVEPENLGTLAAHKAELEVSRKVDTEYLVYLPEDYTHAKSWPLMLFLHGAGERGDDINRVKIHGPMKLVEQGKQFPFIIVAPQCPKDQWWDLDALGSLLDRIESEYSVDADRIYVTGLSMGGYGTWKLALQYPDRFAAIVPICGGGTRGVANRIKHLPIWVFHGDADEVVSIDESRKMVDALKAVGGNVTFTVYPGVGHDSWTQTYDNPELYEWLLSHRR